MDKEIDKEEREREKEREAGDLRPSCRVKLQLSGLCWFDFGENKVNSIGV